jgi:hypothetical protein
MAPFQGLAPERHREIRRAGLYADFERIDRVMSRRIIRVGTDHNSANLAYSTPDGWVYFNDELADDIDTMDGIIRLVGANYHELCHHLDSFGEHSNVVREWSKDTYGPLGHHVWNMLEDQRIERIFLRKWRPTAPYFIALVTKWLLGTDEDKWKDLYPLLVGRTYLDPSMIGKLRVRYVAAHDEDTTMKVQRVAHRYVDIGRMKSTSDVLIAQRCISDLVAVMKKDSQDARDVLVCLPFHSGQAGGGTGADADGKIAGNLPSGSGKVAETPADKDADDPTQGGPAGRNGGSTDDDDGLRDEVEKLQGQALRDEVLQREVSTRMQAVRSRKNLQRKENLKHLPPSLDAVPTEAYAVMRQTANVFRQLVLEEDPGTVTHQSFGKVSMKRAMHGVDFDTVFDRWAPGQQDSTDMEVVILVDQSVSMKGTQHRSSQALWAIQRAIESVSTSSTVSVIGFGAYNVYLAQRGKRINRTHMLRVRAGDSATEPIGALQEAEYIFATSRHSKGILLIFTDGVWQGAGATDTNGWETVDCDEVIVRMNAAGITTALAFLMTDSTATYLQQLRDRRIEPDIHHGVSVHTDITDPAQLVVFAKKVVSSVIKRGRN